MGGIFSTPKAPAPPPGPSQAELDAIARREKLAEETKARESREIAARKRVRRGSQGLMTAFIGRTPEEDSQSTLGPSRNPRA
jgi:hypothetical protein|tara:strand:- start:15314 stop:15559 length:246 start_codon:yes stop_codon:yes gene_type:complete